MTRKRVAVMKAPVTEDASAPPEEQALRIERPTLHHAVVSRIRDLITEGKLAPGSRVHEGQLGEQLGVSRTPLREGLKVLASEGLVELVPGRGARVTTLTAKAVRDMLIVMEALEDLAGRLASQNATDEQIAEIRRVHDEMLRLYRSRDRLTYFKRNQLIHSSILALTGNDPLIAMHGSLQARMKRIRFLGHNDPEAWAGAVAEHEEMISALEARDGKRLARALVVHLKQTWERVKVFL